MSPLPDDLPAPVPAAVPGPPLDATYDEYISSQPPGRDVSTALAADEPYRYRRRVRRPLFLFVITCVTTFLAGCYHWYPVFLGQAAPLQDENGAFIVDADGGDRLFTLPELVQRNWRDGLTFMVCVMGVLLLHEMGHFLMTIRHRIPASFPYFIPMPVMFTGTMGAVISMEGSRANRKEIFDIGLAGPLAGLALTIPLVIIGIWTAHPVLEHPHVPMFGMPLLATLVQPWLNKMPEGYVLQENAIFMAGWVGMLITGLNMMPISQLDGGHVSYALLGRHSRWLGRGLLFLAIAFIVATGNTNWIVMLVIVILIGTDHPDTADDRVKIGALRWTLGLLSLVIPILCFTPVPLSVAP